MSTIPHKRFRSIENNYPPYPAMPIIVGTLMDDAIQLVNDNDMKEAYLNGYFGRGTVSRRVPNRAMIVPPELIEQWEIVKKQTMEKKSKFTDGRDNEEVSRKHSQRNTSVGPSYKHSIERGTLIDDESLLNTISEHTLPEKDVELDDLGQVINANDLESNQKDYDDPLSLLAHDFEDYIQNSSLPSAYSCAAAVSSHSHDLIDFEEARRIAHYVSCPPPRLRHIQSSINSEPITNSRNGPKKIEPATNDVKDTEGTNHANKLLVNDASFGKNEANQAEKANNSEVTSTENVIQDTFRLAQKAGVKFDHIVYESSIIEPEAAVYLRIRSGSRLIVNPQNSGPTSENFSGPIDSTIMWRKFSSSISNFAARAAVFKKCRDLEYIVREGSSFGADFVLYSSGPSASHSMACIVVLPLQIDAIPRRSAASRSSSVTLVENGNENNTSDGDYSNLNNFTPHVALPQNGSVSSSWVHAHAHSRVIGSARKGFLLAHTRAQIPCCAVCAFINKLIVTLPSSFVQHRLRSGSATFANGGRHAIEIVRKCAGRIYRFLEMIRSMGFQKQLDIEANCLSFLENLVYLCDINPDGCMVSPPDLKTSLRKEALDLTPFIEYSPCVSLYLCSPACVYGLDYLENEFLSPFSLSADRYTLEWMSNEERRLEDIGYPSSALIDLSDGPSHTLGSSGFEMNLVRLDRWHADLEHNKKKESVASIIAQTGILDDGAVLMPYDSLTVESDVVSAASISGNLVSGDGKEMSKNMKHQLMFEALKNRNTKILMESSSKKNKRIPCVLEFVDFLEIPCLASHTLDEILEGLENGISAQDNAISEEKIEPDVFEMWKSLLSRLKLERSFVDEAISCFEKCSVYSDTSNSSRVPVTEEVALSNEGVSTVGSEKEQEQNWFSDKFSWVNSFLV